MGTLSRSGNAAHRPSPLTDPSRRPSGMVEIVCTDHGRFVAWCSPPAPSCRIACPLECSADQTSPSLPLPGMPFAGAAGSRVAQPSRSDAVGALGADVDAQDPHRVVEGAEPHSGAEVDPDDTSHCPTGLWCDACSGAADDLAVGTADTDLGIFCITLCYGCAEGGVLPSLPLMQAIKRVHDHAQHLGCTVDDLDPFRRARSS